MVIGGGLWELANGRWSITGPIASEQERQTHCSPDLIKGRQSALFSTDTLAGVLLSQAPRVVSARHGLMIEAGRRFAEPESSTARCCSRYPRAASRSTMCWVL
jgi:hypothetical protein